MSVRQFVYTGWWCLFLGMNAIQLHAETFQEVSVPPSLRTPTVAYEKGIKCMDENNNTEALKLFQEVISESEQDKTVAGKKLFAAAANNAGGILLLDGQLGKAEDMYQKAVEADPTNALAINNLGALFLRQGKIENAQKMFDRAVKTDPSMVLPLNNLADMIINAGQLKMAAKYLAASLRLDPTNQQTLVMMAKVYDLAEMPVQQEAVWKTLVQVAGDTPDSKLRLGGFYLKQRMNVKALQIADELLMAQPDSTDAHLFKGRAFAANGDFIGAEKEFRHVLQKVPDSSMVRGDLAAVLLQTGRLVDATTVATEGTKRFPSEAENWFVLGSCQERAGEETQAISSYQQAVKIDPKHARAWNNLGVIAAKQDKANDAVLAFGKAIAADPYYPDAQYNFGRALVITKTDYERGVRLLASVGATATPAGERARKFIDDLEKIATGVDPGWATQKRGAVQ